MTLTRISDRDVCGIVLECRCGSILLLKAGERARCKCGKEYYCDFSFHVWENIVRVA
jgi:hypothetical protein